MNEQGALLRTITDSGDFGLTNLDIGTNNVLVNENFDIVAVIDWDSVVTAPGAVLHQFPWCIGAESQECLDMARCACSGWRIVILMVKEEDLWPENFRKLCNRRAYRTVTVCAAPSSI